LSIGKLRVALSGDFLTSDGAIYFAPDALSRLRAHPRIALEAIEAPSAHPLTAEHALRFAATITKRNPLAPEALAVPERRLRLIARFGVGLDHLDVAACTAAGVAVATHRKPCGGRSRRPSWR
jgi:phosphoglycerate dehydrogenase-like enzyme